MPGFAVQRLAVRGALAEYNAGRKDGVNLFQLLYIMTSILHRIYSKNDIIY